MATQNLLDIIKSWPKKTTISTPKKVPELFVPSKISEAPKSTGQKLTEIIKSVIPTKVKEDLKNIKPKDILNIPTTPVWIIETALKPYSKEVWKELLTSTKETWKAVKEIFTTDKSWAIKANNLWQAVSWIPAAIVTPAITKTIELSWQWDKIANILIDLGKKEAKLAWLDETKLSDTDYINLWATNIDLATAWLWFLVTKWLSKWVIKSLVKGLKVEWDKLKTKTWNIIDTYATKVWAKVNLLPETKTKPIQDIIPDKNRIQKTDAEFDKKINEAKSPTTTIKLTPELVKEYSIAKKEQPDLTLEQYKLQKELTNNKKLNQVVEQPKIVELPKQVTSIKWVDETIDKNISDIETKIIKWPVLEEWVYKIAVTPEKFSQLTRWALLWDEWIQWFGNYARKSTDVNYWDPTKLTYNVYFKKKPESDLWWTDFKFWDIKLDEVVWIEKRTDKPTTKTETPLIKEIRKQPKLKEQFTPTEKIEEPKINVKQQVSEMLKPKQTLSEVIQSKIKQPEKKVVEDKKNPIENQEVRQSIRDMLFWKKTEKTETWDIFATPEEKAIQQKLDTTKNLQDIISADINKSPDIKFELWVIQQWLQKIPWVREILKAWWKLFIDIRNKLNNVMVITKEWLQWLWDVITWIWNRKKQIVEQSIKDFWIFDLADWSTKNSKELIQVRKILEKNLKEIYTNFWPVKWKDWKFTSAEKFDEVWYNNAKSLLKEQYFESIFKNNSLDNLRFISEIYFRDKNFNKWSKLLLDLLPDNIKTKLKELDEKVSVKYDEDWNVLNPWSLEHEMTTILWKYLEDIWLLRYKKDWYKRWVITKEMYDYLKKNQKDLWLEDIPEFQEFIKKWYDTTLQQTWDLPKWMSSILKKSKNMEKYHIQDPITRMISYADEVWQLIVNKETVDIINNARKVWKEINQYIWKEADKFARKALWLHDIWITWKIAWKVSWWLWATAIIWSLPIMAMSGFTTLLRSTPVFLRNIMWLNIWNINKTIDFLEKSWIEQKFINETWLDKIVWANYSIFWWWAFDKRVKWFLWSMIIKNQLDSLWVKVWKKDDLIEVYQNTLNKLPIEQSNKLISDIWRQLNDLSDFSNLSRWQIHWLDSRIFNTFKNFWRTTTSRYLSYPTQVVNEVYSSMKNWLSKSDLTDRSYQKIAFLLADTLWVYLWAQFIIDKLMPWEDEEKKEILANRLAWWDIKDKLAMLLSYPLQQPWISMVSSTFNNIVKLVEDIKNNWLQKDQIDYTKISWLVRQLSLLMKEKELTSWWTYKYNNEWSDNTIQNTLKFILGYSDWRLDYEVAKNNIDKIQEWDKWLVSNVVDKIISDQNFFYSWLWETFDMAKYALWDRDTKNDFYNFTVRSQSKKNLDTLLSNIKAWEKLPMTAEEWIANAWNWFDIKAEDKDIMWFMKNNLTSNKTAQKELLKVINEVWINNDPLYKWDMNQYMEQLKTKNPALFYQIIKKVINPIIIKIDKDKKTLKDLQYTWSEAWTSFVDEILVDRFENLPRIASDIANRFDKIISENPTDEELASYNELIKTTQKLPYLWDDITDSLSTVVWKRLKWIEWIKDKLDWLPELQNTLKQAAILRGIKFKNNTNENNLVDNIKNIWQTISGDEKTPTTTWLQTQTWYAQPKKKSELVELLKLEAPKQKKYEPLFKTQQWPTLAEILLRK